MAPLILGTTARLQFEELSQLHAQDLLAPLTDARVYRHIDSTFPQSMVELSAEIERLLKPPPLHLQIRGTPNAVVRRLDTKEAIGRLEGTLVDRRAEIAFLFGPNHWGMGFATEAVTWRHSRLATLECINEFWATANPTNARSIRLLQRLGYEQQTREWPRLFSLDAGNLVFRRSIASEATD